MKTNIFKFYTTAE